MTLYTQTRYFDFSSTASCSGSPIVITSVGTGCNSAVSENLYGRYCASYGVAGEYQRYSTVCSSNALDLGNYTRNYVVKSVFVSSEICQGTPLQAYALVADGVCHQDPAHNGSAYLRTNCNGNQPIWEECFDSKCTQCKTIQYTNSPCQLAGAGTSNKVECYTANRSPVSVPGSPTSDGNTSAGGDVTDPFATSSTRRARRHVDGGLMCWGTAVVFFLFFITII
jgi:hypothetical protein